MTNQSAQQGVVKCPCCQRTDSVVAWKPPVHDDERNSGCTRCQCIWDQSKRAPSQQAAMVEAVGEARQGGAYMFDGIQNPLPIGTKLYASPPATIPLQDVAEAIATIVEEWASMEGMDYHQGVIRGALRIRNIIAAKTHPDQRPAFERTCRGEK
jgi:hypothetical protein